MCLFAEETGVPGENKRPAANYWQTQSHNVVSSTPPYLLDSNSLLLTLRYVHELSIRRLLFVYYTYTTEGQYKNVGAVVVVIIWLLNLQLPMQSVPITTKVVSSNPAQARCPRHPEKEGEEQYFDNFIVSRKSSSHETDKVLVSLRHKVEQYTTYYLSHCVLCA
jgi:hypothetical protein